MNTFPIYTKAEPVDLNFMSNKFVTLKSNDNVATAKPSEETSEGKSTFLASFMSTFKSIFGTGILAFPYAVTKAGLGFTLILTTLIGLWSCYTSYLISVCAEHAPKSARSYDAICEVTLGRVGKWIGAVNLLLHQLPVATAYIIFIAVNLSAVCGDACQNGNDYAWWFILTLIPLFIVFCFLKNIALLSPLSFMGNFAVAASLIIIISITVGKIDVDNVHLWRFDLSSFFGICAFAFAGHTEVVPIYLAMSDRKKYLHVIGGVSIIAVVVFLTFGILTYLALGDGINEIIFRSLSGSANDAAKVGMSLVIYFTLPLKMMPAFEVVESLWEEFMEVSKKKDAKGIELSNSAKTKSILLMESQEIEVESQQIGEVIETIYGADDQVDEVKKISTIFSTSLHSIVIRSILCSIPVITAMITSNFGVLVELVGSLSLGLVGFTLPPIMYIRLGCCKSKVSLIFHWILFVFGLTVTVYCTTKTVKNHFFATQTSS